MWQCSGLRYEVCPRPALAEFDADRFSNNGLLGMGTVSGELMLFSIVTPDVPLTATKGTLVRDECSRRWIPSHNLDLGENNCYSCNGGVASGLVAGECGITLTPSQEP